MILNDKCLLLRQVTTGNIWASTGSVTAFLEVERSPKNSESV